MITGAGGAIARTCCTVASVAASVERAAARSFVRVEMVAWAVRSSAEAAWPMAAASRGGNSFPEAKLALCLLSCWVRRDARSRSWLVEARDRGCKALLR